MGKVKDLSGLKYGRLTVIDRAENSKDGRSMWNCMCDCGQRCIVVGKSLVSGHTRSCGCLNKEITSRLSLLDLTGERYGRLVVVGRSSDYVSPSGRHLVRWVCSCDCGNTTIVNSNQLRSGKTKSCGCLKEEKLKSGNVIHSGRFDRLYRVLANMKSRCYDKNNKSYKYYGGRGIKICDEWLSSYVSFKEWAYDNGYNDQAKSGECTIDRIDTNGNYEPSNCRWVSMKVQNSNKRNNISNSNNNDKRP